MSSAVAQRNAAKITTIEPEVDSQRAVVSRMVMPDNATSEELDTYMSWCRMKLLDPVTQAYAIRQKSGKLFFGTSIAGMRSIAARTGKYGPQDGPYWCGQDGVWVDLWLQKDNPAAARVGVKAVDWSDFTYGVATWRECGKTYGNWVTQPSNMLAIRAEANALRRAFPQVLEGVYTREEIEDANTGEITAPPLNINDDIKRLREFLGWSAQDVIAEARNEFLNPITKETEPPIDLKTPSGRQAMHDRLQIMVDSENANDTNDDAVDWDAIDQGVLIDANSRAAGEPGNDSRTA